MKKAGAVAVLVAQESQVASSRAAPIRGKPAHGERRQTRKRDQSEHGTGKGCIPGGTTGEGVLHVI